MLNTSNCIFRPQIYRRYCSVLLGTFSFCVKRWRKFHINNRLYFGCVFKCKLWQCSKHWRLLSKRCFHVTQILFIQRTEWRIHRHLLYIFVLNFMVACKYSIYALYLGMSVESRSGYHHTNVKKLAALNTPMEQS